MNKFKFSGIVSKKFQNDKVTIIKISNNDKKKVYDITASAFDVDIIKEIEENEKNNKIATYVGYMYDATYKKDGNFVNKTNLIITSIE